MMCNKRVIGIGFLIVIIYIVVYFIGTINIHLGSNGAFFHTAFDYPGSEWYCKEYNLTAIIPADTNAQTMYIKNADENYIYAVYCLDDFTVEINTIGNNEDQNQVYGVRYIKRWGKISCFIINYTDGVITFERRNR